MQAESTKNISNTNNLPGCSVVVPQQDNDTSGEQAKVRDAGTLESLGEQVDQVQIDKVHVSSSFSMVVRTIWPTLLNRRNEIPREDYRTHPELEL